MQYQLSVPELYTCLKCGHQWAGRVRQPKVCPQCKRYNWNKAKTANKK